jgi:hypothetical protein
LSGLKVEAEIETARGVMRKRRRLNDQYFSFGR